MNNYVYAVGGGLFLAGLTGGMSFLGLVPAYVVPLSGTAGMLGGALAKSVVDCKGKVGETADKLETSVKTCFNTGVTVVKALAKPCKFVVQNFRVLASTTASLAVIYFGKEFADSFNRDRYCPTFFYDPNCGVGNICRVTMIAGGGGAWLWLMYKINNRAVNEIKATSPICTKKTEELQVANEERRFILVGKQLRNRERELDIEETKLQITHIQQKQLLYKAEIESTYKPQSESGYYFPRKRTFTEKLNAFFSKLGCCSNMD